MVGLDALVVTIRRELHASVAQLGWTVNAYVLSFEVLILLGAMLGDRLGRRRMFTVGLASFTAASAACALAPSAGILIAARPVQGAGAALISPLSLALISAAFPTGARGKAIGIYAAVTGSAVAIGPVVGGAIVGGISWHWIFWLNVPIGIVAIALAPRVLAESYGPRRPLDLPGVALASTGCSPWCGRSSAATTQAGAAPRSSSRCSPARSCWLVSPPNSYGRPPRCCHATCSPTGRSPRPTRRPSCSPRRCLARPS